MARQARRKILVHRMHKRRLFKRLRDSYWQVWQRWFEATVLLWRRKNPIEKEQKRLFWKEREIDQIGQLQHFQGSKGRLISILLCVFLITSLYICSHGVCIFTLNSGTNYQNQKHFSWGCLEMIHFVRLNTTTQRMKNQCTWHLAKSRVQIKQINGRCIKWSCSMLDVCVGE